MRVFRGIHDGSIGTLVTRRDDRCQKSVFAEWKPDEGASKSFTNYLFDFHDGEVRLYMNTSVFHVKHARELSCDGDKLVMTVTRVSSPISAI